MYSLGCVDDMYVKIEYKYKTRTFQRLRYINLYRHNTKMVTSLLLAALPQQQTHKQQQHNILQHLNL